MRNGNFKKTLWLLGPLSFLWLGACAVNEATPEATRTIVPSLSPTEAVVTSTPTPENGPTWASQLTLVTQIEDASIATWSPTRNELVTHNCRMNQESARLFYADAPEFNARTFSPEDSKCNSDNLSRTVFIWSLDGDELFWWGLGAGPGLLSNALLTTDRTFGPPVSLGKQERAVRFHGWLDEDLLLLSNYTGGSARIGSLINVEAQETVAIIPGFQEFYRTSPPAFVGEGPGYYRSEEPIQDTLVQMGDELSFMSYVIPFHASFTDPYGVRFIDWVPHQSQLLTLVWRDTYLLYDENIITELQVWDFNTNEVVPYIPNGYFGRYSPDGRYLAFYAFNKLTQNEDGSFMLTDEIRSSYLYILDTVTNKFLFELNAPALPVFFSDLDVHSPGEDNEALIWAPDSSQLIFIDENDRYSILEINNGINQPITLDTDVRLFMPRWSYDGSYLAINIFAEDQPRTLAIFQVN